MLSTSELFTGILEAEGVQYDPVEKSHYKILFEDIKHRMNKNDMTIMLTAMASVVAMNTKTKSRKNELLEYYNTIY